MARKPLIEGKAVGGQCNINKYKCKHVSENRSRGAYLQVYDSKVSQCIHVCHPMDPDVRFACVSHLNTGYDELFLT